MKDEKKVKQGKKNRAAGSAWELRVRKDLESKGWIVDKWTNNVEFEKIIKFGEPAIREDGSCGTFLEWEEKVGKLSPAKRKYAGPGRPMAIGTGFPDFFAYKVDSRYDDICYTYTTEKETYGPICLIGVEAKSNGYLKPEEREKCKWLLENKIFSRILIASKEKIKNRVHVKYTEFKI